MAINETYRKPGTNTTPVGYEVGGRSPIDGRLVLASYDALKQPYTEIYPDKNIYNGMTVTVVAGKSGKPELYTLSNFDAYVANNFTGDDDAKIAARLACWTQVSADSAALEAELSTALGDLDVTDTAVDGNFVTSVSQTDGLISVTRGGIASDKVSATAVASGADTVAIEGANVDAQIKSLGKTLKTVQDNAAKYTVVKLSDTEIQALTDSDKANIKEAYQVVSYTGNEATATKTPVGQTIKIYKDSALKSVTATNDANGENTSVTFVYTLANGTEQTVTIDLGKAIFESEMGNGIQVGDNKISIKLDTDTESFLSVGANGLKLAGVQEAINNTITSKIGTLDATVGSTTVDNGKHVAVQVVETDGKLTSVTVTESDIASASALTEAITTLENADDAIEGRLDTLEGGVAVAGSVAKTVKDAIDALDYTDTAESGKFVTKVDETNGVITVTRGEVTSGVVKASVVNGDNTTIGLSGETVAAQTAELATAIKAVDTKVDAVGDNAINEVKLNGTAVSATNNSVNLVINGSVINWKSGETTTIEAKLTELATSIDTKITALNGKSVKADANGKLEVVLGTELAKALVITDNGLEWKSEAVIDCGTI